MISDDVAEAIPTALLTALAHPRSEKAMRNSVLSR